MWQLKGLMIRISYADIQGCEITIFTTPEKFHNLQIFLSTPYPASPTNRVFLEFECLFQGTLTRNQKEILWILSMAWIFFFILISLEITHSAWKIKPFGKSNSKGQGTKLPALSDKSRSLLLLFSTDFVLLTVSCFPLIMTWIIKRPKKEYGRNPCIGYWSTSPPALMYQIFCLWISLQAASEPPAPLSDCISLVPSPVSAVSKSL